jgi:serine/threonine protein kinase
MNDAPSRDVAVFAEAIQLPVGARNAYLDLACGSDLELRQKVEALLKGYDVAGDFLEHSPRQAAAESRAIVGVSEKTGDRIGRYKLLQQIGEGGCGIVFMAEQEEPVRRRVALKIIKPGMDTRSVIARFEAERQALALMDHPGIAKMLDAGATTSGRPYFVMELVRGTKITDYCDKQSLTTERRLKLFVQVCRAVQHAHQKGIIHRDIKPSNILVTTTLEGVPLPVVIDFGIAKAVNNQRLTDKTLFTAFEMLVGTPAYMSPEQAELAGADVDTRTDIYSLGVLLYELLTGSTPFDTTELSKSGLDEIRRVIREQEPVCPSTRLSRMTGADLTTIAQSHMSEPPTLIHAVRGDLDWIAMKALEKDRRRRYETANGMALDVERYLANEPVSARPPSQLYKLRKTVQRNQLLFAGIGVIAVLLVAGLIGVSVSLAREQRLRRAAQAAEAKAETASDESRQVTRFLEDMLKGVEPEVALGQDTTMLRGILDRTAERIGQEMTNQPVVEAELCDLIGRMELEVGDFPQGEKMQRAALALDDKLYGPASPAAATTLNNLALGLVAQEKLTEAEQADRDAFTIRLHLYGHDNADTATSLNDLGAVYRQEGKLAEAEAKAREALEIRQKLSPQESLPVADSLRNLSIILGDESKWVEAEAMAREVLAIRRKLLGPDHPWVASSLDDVAWAAKANGKLAEAEALEQEALALRQKFLPEAHPNVAYSLYVVGDTMREQGKFDEAYSILSAALSIQRKVLGDDNPGTVDTLRSMGLALGAEGKEGEAENTLRAVLAARRKRAGHDDPQALGALHDLGLALGREGKWDEAESIHREALAGWLRVAGQGDPRTLDALHTLSFTLMGEEKWPEAETALRQALAGWRKQAGNEDPQTLYVLRDLGATLEHEGRWSEAEAAHRDELAAWRKQAGDEDLQTLYTMHRLSLTLQGEGKWPEAEQLHRDAVDLWRKRAGNEDPGTLQALGDLGATLDDEGKWSEAEQVNREALGAWRKQVGDADPQTLLALHRLGITLEGEGKWDEAENVWREDLSAWRHRQGNEDPNTLYALRDLGITLEGEGKWEEAEAAHREELANWRHRAGNDDPQTLYALYRLALTLKAEGKWEEAETLHGEALAGWRQRGEPEPPQPLADLESVARALANQGKIHEAKQFLDKTLGSLAADQPPGASLLALRSEIEARLGLWPEAAADERLAVEREPMEHTRFPVLAVLLIRANDRGGYEQFCNKLLAGFTNTSDIYAADQVAKSCLFLPSTAVDLGAVNRLADMTVTKGVGDSGALPYFQDCKALCEYRLGHYAEAYQWIQKSLQAPGLPLQGHAYGVLAMIDWRLGKTGEAQEMLAKGNALAPLVMPDAIAAGPGDHWLHWIYARIQLDEATALIEP